MISLRTDLPQLPEKPKEVDKNGFVHKLSRFNRLITVCTCGATYIGQMVGRDYLTADDQFYDGHLAEIRKYGEPKGKIQSEEEVSRL